MDEQLPDPEKPRLSKLEDTQQIFESLRAIREARAKEGIPEPQASKFRERPVFLPPEPGQAFRANEHIDRGIARHSSSRKH